MSSATPPSTLPEITLPSKFQKIIIPPFRYEMVEDGLYRGAYPSMKNFRFLRRLQLKSIVSLTSSPPSLDLLEFCVVGDIRHFHFTVASSKEKAVMRTHTVVQVLQTIIDPANLPLYIHCQDGVRASGIVIMCLRKLQRWNMTAIVAEYCRFTRGAEISRKESEYVESFKADIVVPHAVPRWLWRGHREESHSDQRSQHADFRLQYAPAPASAAVTRAPQERSAEIREQLIRPHAKAGMFTSKHNLHEWSLTLRALNLELPEHDSR
eukprot:TRINITY_DN7066_c0_g2_i1.p1 TRINITY_DN7066_c0_g2~~TRINITY_DN7066_c0_g2_i1.p1  ORF type:complete len:266 (+),score=27.25 TRINITY_DN7066_c0_g2_i1:38-835(+)